MKIYKTSEFEKCIKEAMGKINCNFAPLNAPTRIDVQSLITDVLNLHFKDDTLQAEESDIGIRLQDYTFYDLRLIDMSQIQSVESVKYAPVDINKDNIKSNLEQISKTGKYPPVVLDIMGHVIDGYHRIFALKKLGCSKVWAYVPDKTTYNNQDEDFDDED